MAKGTNLAHVFDIAEVEKLHDGDPMDGDGEDDGDESLETIQVDIATNGFMLTYLYDDGSALKYVLNDFNEVLEHMRSNF